MALYAIGDLHLSETVNKPMGIFGGWENHTQKICENWRKNILAEDTVVLCGDTSWGMNLDEALADFKLIDSLNGKQKLILKGNHDYWWCSAAKMQNFFDLHGLSTLKILHNNSFEVENFRISGSRGWIFENGQAHDEKIINREATRIEASLKAAASLNGEGILFLHYPPLFQGQELRRYIEIMHEYGIKRCFYGHIHGAGHKIAPKGTYHGIDFVLISADYLKFCPLRIQNTLKF